MNPAEPEAVEIRTQHATLLATLHMLAELLPYAAVCPDRPRPLDSARTLLARLLAQLRAHFEVEERDDSFRRIAVGDPRLTSRIEALQRDHRELTALAIALLAEARASDEEAAWNRILRRFWQLRERLAWHEREENELVFQLYQVDLGQSMGG